jgi:hypothetical protein
VLTFDANELFVVAVRTKLALQSELTEGQGYAFNHL